jgi:hypothetical protein
MSNAKTKTTNFSKMSIKNLVSNFKTATGEDKKAIQTALRAKGIEVGNDGSAVAGKTKTAVKPKAKAKTDAAPKPKAKTSEKAAKASTEPKAPIVRDRKFDEFGFPLVQENGLRCKETEDAGGSQGDYNFGDYVVFKPHAKSPIISDREDGYVIGKILGKYLDDDGFWYYRMNVIGFPKNEPYKQEKYLSLVDMKDLDKTTLAAVKDVEVRRKAELAERAEARKVAAAEKAKLKAAAKVKADAKKAAKKAKEGDKKATESKETVKA